MIGFLVRMVFYGLIIYLSTETLDGFTIEYPSSDIQFWLVFAQVLAAVAVADLIIIPALKLITLPIRIITLGLSNVLVQGIVIYAIAQLIEGFTITNYVSLVMLVFAFSIVRYIPR